MRSLPFTALTVSFDALIRTFWVLSHRDEALLLCYMVNITVKQQRTCNNLQVCQYSMMSKNI